MKHMKSAHHKGKKNWIAGAIKHPGALRRELGVKAGSKIPKSRIQSAAKSGNTTLARRAQLALNLSKMHHKMPEGAADHMKHAEMHEKMAKHHKELAKHYKHMKSEEMPEHKAMAMYGLDGHKSAKATAIKGLI